jgi:tetratricopeptide (TPR) repeat protein
MIHTRLVCTTCALAVIALAAWSPPQAWADAPEQDASPRETEPLEDGDRVRLEVGPAPDNAVKLVPFPEDLEEAPAEQAPRAAAADSAVTADPAAPPTLLKIGPAQPLAGAAASESTDRAAPAAPRRMPPAAKKHVLRLPSTAIAPKHAFQPRFRTPDVRPAQHVEPARDSDAGDAAAIASDAPPQGAGASPAAVVETTRQADQSPGGAATAPTAQAAPAANGSGGKPLVEEAFAKSKAATTEADYTTIIDLCRRAQGQGLSPKLDAYSQRLMSWAYNRRGEALVAQQRDTEALADFESAARLNPESWRAVHNRGVSYAAEGRTKEAIADFDRTIKLNPGYANAYYNRGELAYGQGRFEDAIRDYTAAIDLGPADAAMYNSRGHAHYRLQQFGDALREYGRALEMDPKYAVALVNRGDTYADVGRYAEAAADYRAAIAADASLGRAYTAAAWLMATCPDAHYRNDKLAIEAAQKAIQLDGENYRNLETLAAAQASNGLFAEAKDTQERAIAKAPREQLVAAEKRMALYQRDLAYREVSQQQAVAANQARMQAEAEKKQFPVEQASANVPDVPGQVTYPETQAADAAPRAAARRSFWPQQLNPFGRSQQPQPQRLPETSQRPRSLPKKPTRTPAHVRPW